MSATRFGSLDLQPATRQDQAFWLAVRNDDAAVRWSRSREAVTPLAHADWFVKMLARPEKTRLFIVMLTPLTGGAPASIGIARLDHRRSWTEVSLALAPAFRAKGFGPRVARLLTETAARLGWPQPGAIVHGHNQRSIRCFLRAGFQLRASRWLEFRYEAKGR